jgi:hypothetical protein
LTRQATHFQLSAHGPKHPIKVKEALQHPWLEKKETTVDPKRFLRMQFFFTRQRQTSNGKQTDVKCILVIHQG